MDETIVAIKEVDSSDSRSLHVWIEVVQMVSLAALVIAWVLHTIDSHEPWQVRLLVTGVIFFMMPFFMVSDAGKEGSGHGYRLNPERLATLKQMKVPDDIVDACAGPSILGIPFAKGELLKVALYDVLGKARVQPYLHTILLHAQLYRKPLPPAEKGANSPASGADEFGGCATEVWPSR